VCLGPDTDLHKAFKAAPAVFIARVIAVEERGDARLEVEEVYKGKVGPTAIVASGFGADCRPAFFENKRYIFFASPDAGARIPPPGLCDDPTQDVEKNPKVVAWVRRHRRVAIESGRVAPPQR
jgi:hypothetical protein